jgi:hypothetical protein
MFLIRSESERRRFIYTSPRNSEREAIGFGGVVFCFIGRGEVQDIILYLLTCLLTVGHDILLVMRVHGRVGELCGKWLCISDLSVFDLFSRIPTKLFVFSFKIHFYNRPIK